MEFHISSHHPFHNYGLHRVQADGTRSPNALPNWAAHCEKICTTYNTGGVNQAQHNHFMFVETGDMSKLRDLIETYQGYWDITVTPIINCNSSRRAELISSTETSDRC